MHSLTYIKFVVEQPETVNQKTVRSVDPSHDGGPRKELLGDVFTFVLFFIERDVPAIELFISKSTTCPHGYYTHSL